MSGLRLTVDFPGIRLVGRRELGVEIFYGAVNAVVCVFRPRFLRVMTVRLVSGPVVKVDKVPRVDESNLRHVVIAAVLVRHVSDRDCDFVNFFLVRAPGVGVAHFLALPSSNLGDFRVCLDDFRLMIFRHYLGGERTCPGGLAYQCTTRVMYLR